MPEMGGFDTCQSLRESSPALPIVICTGSSADGHIDEINNDEHAAMIQKPYNPEQLRDVIATHIPLDGGID